MPNTELPLTGGRFGWLQHEANSYLDGMMQSVSV